jgi:hypothetical protein
MQVTSLNLEWHVLGQRIRAIGIRWFVCHSHNSSGYRLAINVEVDRVVFFCQSRLWYARILIHRFVVHEYIAWSIDRYPKAHKLQT